VILFTVAEHDNEDIREDLREMAGAKQNFESLNTAFLQLHNLFGLLTRLEEGTYSKKAGISYQQYLVLVVLESNKPPVNETVIANRLQRGLNTISLMIDRMEKGGLLVRRWSEHDRRRREITLTKQGKDALDRGLKVGVDLRKRLGREFTDKQLDDLTALASKLRDSVLQKLGHEVPSPDLDRAVRERVIRLYERAAARQAD